MLENCPPIGLTDPPPPPEEPPEDPPPGMGPAPPVASQLYQATTSPSGGPPEYLNQSNHALGSPVMGWGPAPVHQAYHSARWSPGGVPAPENHEIHGRLFS